MCGINGIYDRLGRDVEPAVVNRMRDVMRYRGPDDAGTYTGRGIGLGHRRLSIIDLSPAGRQPMAAGDGQAWITFNGEIYNFLELREELAGLGHIFKSRSDTEVLLAAYRQWGEGFVARLRGMFAIGLWDERSQSLLLARDRVGKKPLFYAERDSRVYFASDVKAIVAALDSTPPVDPIALDGYLTYLSVPQDRSIYEGVRKLLPATYAVFTRDSTRFERYWRLDFRHKVQLTEREALDRLDATLEDAVKARLVADVPLGAFLSGGIDSSLVVAMMAKLAGTVKTFSIGFGLTSHNELPYARAVADRYATEHREFTVNPDAAAILPHLVWQYGEPFADSSALPTYYVAQLARQEVTVALNGDGGDESFAGYSRSRLVAAAALYRRAVPGAIRRGLAPGLADFLVQVLGRRGPVSKFKTLADYGRLRADQTYVNDSVFLDYRDALYTPEFKARLGAYDPNCVYQDAFREALANDDVDRALGADIVSWLPDDLLVKVDVATMAHSLEARSPFLDHRVMEFAASLSPSLKLAGGQSKHLLKQLALRYLPEDVIFRPKMGFSVPLDHWFRTELRQYLEQLLLDPRSLNRGYFEPDAVRKLIGEHMSGRANHGHRLWTLFWLELWHRMFIDGTLSQDASLKDL